MEKNGGKMPKQKKTLQQNIDTKMVSFLFFFQMKRDRGHRLRLQ